MPFFTIFTPTYNRRRTLFRLYNSLLFQTFKDFEWLIIDDGSSDNTELDVKAWKDTGEISIRYYYQSNGGKHVAYNNGIDLAKGKYFFCVDSDDWLPENSLENLFITLSNIRTNAIGVVGQKVLENGMLLSKPLPSGTQCTLFDLSERYGFSGEWSIIYKTETSRRFKFPVIEGEKFSTESIIYDAMSRSGYQFLVIDQIYTICEYQENGLSNGNPYKSLLSNPGCFKIYYGNRIDMSLIFKERLKNIVRYWAFFFMFDHKKYNYCGKHLLLVYLMLPLGFAAWIYYKSNKA